MTLRAFVSLLMVAAVMTTGVTAQQPQPGAGPVPVREPPAPPLDQPNVQFDIAISDEGGGVAPVKKSVVLMVQAGGSGSLRSNGVGTLESGRGNRVVVDLNADVKLPHYSVQQPNKIRARIAIDYQPFAPEWKTAPGRVRAQVDVVLDNGKRTMLWQTTDPVMGLRTMIEVTATVLK